MTKMLFNIVDLKNLTEDQLKKQLILLKKQAYNLRFKKANGELDKTSEVRKVKKAVAKVLTLINDKNKTKTK